MIGNVTTFRETLRERDIAFQFRVDRFCGLVVRVPGYIHRESGSISGATRFSEKCWV
jgi:hypothetical protein